ncbi:MAG: proline dehydrogenase family protein, partial [Chlamydiia bacterium]|nr:proline dehydrogenase family protein [Chlamydiia bacterium]
PQRTASQLLYLLKQFGIPKFLSCTERLKFHLFKLIGPLVPPLLVPLIRRKLRQEMEHVLIPSSPQAQLHYFKRRWKEGTRINLNHLGEAVLGEEEALRRLHVYLHDLANPLIEYISVKISTLFSQINMVGFIESLEVLKVRLHLLFTTAQKHSFQRADGTIAPKFVNLDMEEYKDLELTVAAFQSVLDTPDLHRFSAGIVLQSYLPDSFEVQKQLTEWAKRRCAQGGAPITIRLVKGANLAMEKFDSALHLWEEAPFTTKKETDGQYKKMLEYAVRSENIEAVHIGVASHNLFEIAYALLLQNEYCLGKRLHFEQLEGMAPPMQRIIHQLSGSMLLYCPEAKERDFHNAVAYLIRRLDENCGPENFLRHYFELHPGTP